jgi:methylated-DNA-[protein]-cysteine S-methyltransferase
MNFHHLEATTHVTSPLGRIVLAASHTGLAGLWFDGQQHFPDLPDTLLPVAAFNHPVLREAAAQLAAYFAGERGTFDLPLDLGGGTAFQQSVWQALLAIEAGETASYAEVAARIGNPAAVRAVGAAIGRNPVSIVVPCHRVIGSGGALTGYAGGLARKTALLQLEREQRKSLV